MDKTVSLFILGILGVSGSFLPENGVSYVLDGSTCETRELTTQTMDTSLILKTSAANSTNGIDKTRECVSKISFRGSLQDKGMEVYFLKEVNNFYDVTVTHNSGNKSSKIHLFPSDRWIYCLNSIDHVTELEINYRLRRSYAGNITVFQTSGVKTCPVKFIESLDDKPLIQEDSSREIGRSNEPKVGTATTSKVTVGKPPLDIIIIVAVAVAAVVGITISVFAIRRWIRNNVAEERRQSVIRVNSQGSTTRSTSNSLQSTTRAAQHGDQAGARPASRDRGYGSVTIGGRLPSSEDDSDLFPDETKSVKTVLDYE